MKQTLSNKQRHIKRVSIILIAAVLSYVIFSMAGSVLVFRIIFARTAAVNAFELTYSDVDAARYPREEISFDSGGNRLRGAFYRPQGKSAGLVLVLNGINCCLDRHLPEIMRFVDCGFTALTFENTGVGQSEGDTTVGLAQARLDAEAAIAFIRQDETLSGLPLVLYGHSLGGYAAATALRGGEDIRAAVCVSSFNSPNENMRYNARARVGVLADVQYPFMCLQNYFLFGDKSDDTAVGAINATDTPVMIVGGSFDEIVPSEISLLDRADEITNPNAVTLRIDDPYRARHSSAWLSRDAARYLAETDDPTDKQRANVLDDAFMERVVSFYRQSIQ